MLQGATFEVVPEPGEPRALRLERRHVHHGLGRAGLGATQLLLRAFAFRELAAIVLGEMLLALALFLLPHEVADKLLDDLAPGLPEPAELVEHDGRIGRLGNAETHLEGVQHFLHAHGRAFLLLDAVLEPVDFFLQLPVGFLQLGAIAKKREDTVVLHVPGRALPCGKGA